MRLIIAPVHKLPVVSIMAVVEAGATSDPHGREGLAQLTARALVEGTATMDGMQLTERLEGIGSSIEPATDWDYVSASTTVLTSRAHAALQLLGEVLMTPAFPEREIERLKRERVAELMQQRAEPRGLADEMFSRFLYGAASRYAEPEGGSEKSVEGLQRDDVVAFHRRQYRPGTTILVIAGDVASADAVRMIEETFGSWSGPAPIPAAVRDTPARLT